MAVGSVNALMWLVVGVLLMVVGLARIGWHHLGRYRAAHRDRVCCCGACDVADVGDVDDEPGDDLMALHDAVFDGEDVVAVNEDRPSRWDGLDVTSPNTGAWLDRVSRERIQNLGPWLTRTQQDQVGKRFVSYAEQILKDAAETEAEQARQAREKAARLGETTVEIRRGDPGE
jgi:hypothetical protein